MMMITLMVLSQLCGTSGFIDIPSVSQYDIPGMIGASFSFSFPFSTEDPNPLDSDSADPNDFSMALRYGLGGRAEIALSMYTLSTYALSVGYLLKKEHGSSPAWFIGIDDISYDAHLSTLGRGDTVGYIEEQNYARLPGGRPAELLSAYLGMEKHLGERVRVVLGIGRGRFVGYGPRSHVFNTDFFVLGEEYRTEEHSAWAFGLFGGGAVCLPGGVELMAEMDGRDGNMGLRYQSTLMTFTLALTKVEHFWSPKPYSPRLLCGLELTNRGLRRGPNVGSMDFVVQDATTKQALAEAVIDIKEMNKRYQAKGGTFSMTLPVGNYTITVSKPNYVDYIAKISVKSGVKSVLIFDLKKTQETLKREAEQKEKEANARTYLEQGKIYYTEGNLDEAKAAFEMVLALNPENNEAKDYLTRIEPRRKELIATYTEDARSKTRANDIAKAIELWKKVLSLDANSNEAKTEIANLQSKITAVQKPSKPTTPSVPKKETSQKQIAELYKKGVSLFTSEKYDEALKTFKQVLVLDPKHSGALDYKQRTEARIKVLKGGG